MTTPQTLGDRLTELLHASGMSLGQLSKLVTIALGQYSPSTQTVGQLHRGKVSPKRADLVLLATLADIYGVDVSSLHPIVAERYASARKVLARSRCSSPTLWPTSAKVALAS